MRRCSDENTRGIDFVIGLRFKRASAVLSSVKRMSTRLQMYSSHVITWKKYMQEHLTPPGPPGSVKISTGKVSGATVPI